MKKHTPILISTACALFSGDALADERASVGGFAGAHIFNQNIELGAFDTSEADSPRNAGAFGVRAGYELWRYLRAEAELVVMPSKTRESEDDVTVFAWRAQALVDLLPDSRLRPFALLGVGLLTISSTNKDILDEDTDLVSHLGLGVEYDMADTWSLRADARALLVPTVNSDFVTADFEFFIGAVKRFPVEQVPLPTDGDGDGVFDGDDKCPDEKEDQDGFDDDDGCPDLDNDNDGVPDTIDQCPAEAESKNGIDDDDGCPEPDGDGDGLVGSQDKCPREAEDKDGVDDMDGCPEADPEPEAGPDAISPAPADGATPAGGLAPTPAPAPAPPSAP